MTYNLNEIRLMSEDKSLPEWKFMRVALNYRPDMLPEFYQTQDTAHAATEGHFLALLDYWNRMEGMKSPAHRPAWLYYSL